jgi:hypothetical protein
MAMKKITIPFLLLCILLLMIAYKERVKQQDLAGTPVFKHEDYHQIVLTNSQQMVIHLQKDSLGNWFDLAHNWPVDSQKVAQFMNSLRLFQTNEVVSELETRHHEFGLDTPSVWITAFSLHASEPVEVAVGKHTGDFLYTYFSKPTSPLVYQTTGFVSVSVEPRQWLVARFIPWELDDWHSVHYTWRTETGSLTDVMLERNANNEWVSSLLEGKIDQTKALQFVRRLGTVAIDDWRFTHADSLLPSESFQGLRIVNKNDEVFAVNIMGEWQGHVYYVHETGKPVGLATWRFTGLERKMEDLLVLD